MASNAQAPTPHYILWTDGSSVDDAVLGWGVALWRKNKLTTQTLAQGKTLSEPSLHSSEIAEWNAVISGLQLLGTKRQPVWVLSDSELVVRFINDVATNRMITAVAPLDIVGKDAFFALGALVVSFPKILAIKIKGHAASAGNNLCDALATSGRRSPKRVVAEITSEAILKEAKTVALAGNGDHSAKGLCVKALGATGANVNSDFVSSTVITLTVAVTSQ